MIACETAEDKNVADQNEFELASVNKTKMECRRAAKNLLGFKDVLAMGIHQIEDKQLPKVRYRKVLRNARKRKSHEYMYESI